mgnify:CR=1 FL=1
MRKLFENIEKKIFIPAFLVLIVLTLTIYLFPGQVNGVISILFSLCTHELGWLFMLTCLASFGFMIWLTFSKYGKIKLGNKDEKPQYNNLSWIAMLFTAGVGTSIVILGFLEPIYYVSAPPFDLEPFSNAAYEYAHMYGQFHWGFSAWAFYNPAIVAIAYVMYVRKENSIRLSNACRSVLHKKSDGWLGHIVDILVVFGIVGSISTSLGIGAPVLSDIIREVFGIPAQYDFTVKIIVLIIWVLIFGTSVYLGLDKGIQRLSNINVVLAFIFMGLILLITFMTLLGCSNVTENGALVDLSGHLGGWVSIIGYVFSLFSLLALATSFWANTLNLRDIVNEQTKWGEKISWLAATLPCLVIALVGVQSFVGFTRMASVVQVLTGVGVIVAYNRSRKRAGTSLICGRLGSLPFQILAVAASLVASVGAVLTVTV